MWRAFCFLPSQGPAWLSQSNLLMSGHHARSRVRGGVEGWLTLNYLAADYQGFCLYSSSLVLVNALLHGTRLQGVFLSVVPTKRTSEQESHLNVAAKGRLAEHSWSLSEHPTPSSGLNDSLRSSVFWSSWWFSNCSVHILLLFDSLDNEPYLCHSLLFFKI